MIILPYHGVLHSMDHFNTIYQNKYNIDIILVSKIGIFYNDTKIVSSTDPKNLKGDYIYYNKTKMFIDYPDDVWNGCWYLYEIDININNNKITLYYKSCDSLNHFTVNDFSELDIFNSFMIKVKLESLKESSRILFSICQYLLESEDYGSFECYEVDEENSRLYGLDEYNNKLIDISHYLVFMEWWHRIKHSTSNNIINNIHEYFLQSIKDNIDVNHMILYKLLELFDQNDTIICTRDIVYQIPDMTVIMSSDIDGFYFSFNNFIDCFSWYCNEYLPNSDFTSFMFNKYYKNHGNKLNLNSFNYIIHKISFNPNENIVYAFFNGDADYKIIKGDIFQIVSDEVVLINEEVESYLNNIRNYTTFKKIDKNNISVIIYDQQSDNDVLYILTSNDNGQYAIVKNQ